MHQKESDLKLAWGEESTMHRMPFHWCATGIGVLPNDVKPIDGSDIQEGDAVVSLRSCGLRSNGYSLARKNTLVTLW